MNENKNNKQLVNTNELEKKITSPNTIDYLAGKIKEHDLKGIKLEVKHPSGPQISLAL